MYKDEEKGSLQFPLLSSHKSLPLKKGNLSHQHTNTSFFIALGVHLCTKTRMYPFRVCDLLLLMCRCVVLLVVGELGMVDRYTHIGVMHLSSPFTPSLVRVKCVCL